MKTIKSILYATDLTKNSAHAFQYAIDIADKYNAKIHILHLIEPLPSNVRIYLDVYNPNLKLDAKPEKIIEKIKTQLNAFCENIRTGDPECSFKVDSIDVHEGYPVQEIISKVKKTKYDLIVMGSHGKGIIGHAFLGSVSEKVLRRMNIPVLIVPLPENESEITAYDF